MASYPSSAQDYVVASYRYLRLAMVVLVLTLFAAIVIERSKATCWQDSISAYYYTPVHSIFVGVLVAIGVSLIALKGRDIIEDMFFNLAGALAPVVALVPTSRPSNLCSRAGDELTLTTSALVSNNIIALIVGILIALGLTYFIAVKDGGHNPDPKGTVRSLPRATAFWLSMSGALVLAGIVWYHTNPAGFEKYSHGAAAGAMFVAVWCAIMVNAEWPAHVLRWIYRVLGAEFAERTLTERRRRFRRVYRLMAIAMVLGAALVVGTVAFGATWDHRVLWLEILEIVPFALFWYYQTREAWERAEGPSRLA